MHFGLDYFTTYRKIVGMINRIYEELLKEHFASESNMAILVGPRQSGKTTTAINFKANGTSYWNWDDQDDRIYLRSSPQKFLDEKNKRDSSKKVLVLDEIHKNKKWRNWLKGFYDKHNKEYQIIVTGSARLNVFKKGGDSLLGRYYPYRHHPLSLGEIENKSFETSLFRKPCRHNPETYKNLFKFGGFPAPFIAGKETSHAKWIRTRRELLVREDLRDLSKLEDVAAMELLVTLLKDRVGGLLNLNNIKDDVHVSVDTLRRWIKYLEALYYIYLVPPYTKNVKRALIKAPKLYLWDWSETIDEAARFENIIASHLLKSVHYWTDTGLGEFNLHFIRDKEKREVDFLVTQDNAPFMLVECKLSEKDIQPSLKHFNDILKPKYSLQVVHNMESRGGISFADMTPNNVVAATDFCSAMI